MERARIISQKECEPHYGSWRPEEIKLQRILGEMKRGAGLTTEEWKFLCKEMDLSLRTAYGIYLAMCKEEGIGKTISWRTFYMQFNGYRTLKPNTVKALVRYVNMVTEIDSVTF